MTSLTDDLRRPASRWTLWLICGCVPGLFFHLAHRIRKPPLVFGTWAALCLGLLPLLVIIWLELSVAQRRRWPGICTAVLMSAGLTLCALPSWLPGGRAAVKALPGLLWSPALVLLLLSVVLAQRLSVPWGQWGLGLGDVRWWAPRALLLSAGAIGIAVLAATFDPEILAYYPDHKPARTDAGELTAYVLTIAIYMLAWEFFFRGYLLFGLARSTGPVAAIALSSLPFFILHKGGPDSELLGSFVGSLLLGAFCWRARSALPAPFLHWILDASVQVICFILRVNTSGETGAIVEPSSAVLIG